jgi:hypothetical protein
MFNFSHHYKKLDQTEFTTIRSLDYAKKHNLSLNQIGDVTLDRSLIFKVKIVRWEDKRICDMPLELLQKDVEYEGFTISTYHEFVDGLNQIVLNSGIPYANNRLTTKKRIFYLRKIDYINKAILFE